MLKLIVLGALGYAGYKYYQGQTEPGARYAGTTGKTGDIHNIDEVNPATRPVSSASVSPAI